MQPGPQNPVLIAGAGPTGLLLAIWLARFSVPFRIVDRSPRKAETSRAVVVHARTLEFYRQLGIADEVVAAGQPVTGFRILHEGKVQDTVWLADAGKGLSHYPYILSLPQDRHEELLEDVLGRLGASVERGVEVTGLTPGDDDHDAEVSLRHVNGGRQEQYLASFVAGCDGARSAVRHAAGMKMEGGTYKNSFFVADAQVDAAWAEGGGGSLSMGVSRKDFCLYFPLPGSPGEARLIGLVPEEVEDKETVAFEEVKSSVDRNLKLDVQKVNWISKYKVHHRMASSFQEGRTFVLGDAAHIHSPVGGQGMNTGLGDATNLAWKLAAVYKHAAPLEIVRTYSKERMPFAKLLLDTTDYAFTLITSDGMGGKLMRNWVFPLLVPFVANFMNMRSLFFKRVSQTVIEYRESPISATAGSAKGAAAGDRLPYVELDGSSDNHAALGDRGWQAHVYGTPSDDMIGQLASHQLQPVAFAWSDAAASKGLCQDALYLIRPDGYIGLIATKAEISQASSRIGDYCREWGVWGASQA